MNNREWEHYRLKDQTIFKSKLNSAATSVNAVVDRLDLILTQVDDLNTQIDAILTEVNAINTRVDAVTALVMHQSNGDNGFAIHGTNKDNVLTTAATEYLIDGKPYSLAAQTEIVTPAATAQGADTKCWYLALVDAAAAITWVKGVDNATTAVVPAMTASTALIGAAHVSLASGATFTLGTTAFDAANVTSTFFAPGYASPGLTALGAAGLSALGASGLSALGTTLDLTALTATQTIQNFQLS